MSIKFINGSAKLKIDWKTSSMTTINTNGPKMGWRRKVSNFSENDLSSDLVEVTT